MNYCDNPLLVFIGCEESGTVRDAFRRAGHHAFSCDLKPSRGEFKQFHFQMDIVECLSQYANGVWDLAILFPECEKMAVSGNGTYTGTAAREEALNWTVSLWHLADLKAKAVCMENPKSTLWPRLRSYTDFIQFVHPYWFGYPEKKQTGLGLKNLPRLCATNQLSRSALAAIPKQDLQRVNNMRQHPDRKRDRSVTNLGMAEAMVQQWGGGSFSRVPNGLPKKA